MDLQKLPFKVAALKDCKSSQLFDEFKRGAENVLVRFSICLNARGVADNVTTAHNMLVMSFYIINRRLINKGF
jgi:hypothetical protein